MDTAGSSFVETLHTLSASTQIGRGLAVVAAVFLQLGIGSAAAGQQSSELNITLHRVTSLGGPSDPASPSVSSRVSRDSRGRYYVAPTYSPGTFSVYSAEGDHLREVGRSGKGPGEYGDATLVVVGHGDSLHIVDIENRRLTVLGPDYEFARSTPIPMASTSAIPLPSGHFVFAGPVFTPDHAGLALHIMEAGGARVMSFDAAPGAASLSRPWEYERILGSHSAGLFWSAPINDYRVELWDTAGTRRLALDLERPWFRPWEDPSQPGSDEPPNTSIMGLQWQEPDILWVIAGVPDEDWRPGPSQMRLPGPTDMAATWDVIVEAIDARRGVVLASRRFGFPMLPVQSTANMLFRFREDRRGNITLDIVELRLVDSTSRTGTEEKQ